MSLQTNGKMAVVSDYKVGFSRSRSQIYPLLQAILNDASRLGTTQTSHMSGPTSMA